jgi:ABC-type transport system substrate-binding protein
MVTKRLLILAPLLLVAVLLQSFFWVPTYEEQTRGNPDRITRFISASIGDARLLNPVISADGSSSQINSLVFDSLLDLDENLALRPKLAESWELGSVAYVVARPGLRLPGGTPAEGEPLRAAVEEGLGGLATAVRLEAAQTRTTTRTVMIPGGEDGPPRPEEVEVTLRLPERVAIELPGVFTDLDERLAGALGADYLDGFEPGRHVDVPDGPGGDLVRAQLGSLLPALEHNPILQFRLRRGVRFHDGHELDAGDVRFTWQAILDPRNISPRTSDFDAVRDVEVVDSHTLRVVYSRLFSPAVYAWSYMGILPEHLLNEEAMAREMDEKGITGEARASYGLRQAEFSRRPVGTGPFRFERWESDHYIHLMRNEDYFEGPAEYAEYFFRIIPDPLTQEVEFRTGAIDSYPAQPHQAARYRADERYQSFSSVGFGYTYIGYNVRRPLFRDPEVRRALGMAIDVDQINEYVLYGEAERVTGPYAITTEWYDRDVPPIPFDPEGAREILESKGWKPGQGGILERDGERFEFTLITNNGNPQRKAIATIAQNSWRKLGIDCRVQLFEWAVFLKDFINVGEFDATVLGWSTGIDPDQFQIWHSSQTRPQQLNFVGYEDAEADRLIEEIRLEYDRERQRELAHALHRRIADAQPYTFLYAARGTSVLDRKIVMVERNPDGTERIVPVRPTPTGELTYFFTRWKKLDHVPAF